MIWLWDNHGYNHYWWNSLNKEEMSKELDLSINFLEKLGVDMNNWTACYPYGSYDDQSIKMLRERGCKLALTTEVDIATTNKNTRFIMPRLDTNDIPKDKKSKRFEEIHNLINQFHEEGMSNKEISNYLNSNNIKTPKRNGIYKNLNKKKYRLFTTKIVRH